MKKNIAILLLCWITTTPLFANIHLKGTIGPYNIEMELWKGSGENPIEGRYRYAGKKSYLDLKGTFWAGQAFELKEYWKEKQTGEFMVDITPYSQSNNGAEVSGYWNADTTIHEVKLTRISGNWNELKPYLIPEIKANVSNSVEGTYAADEYWVNKYCGLCDLGYEITFNGGMVTVEEYDTDTLLIHFSFTSGPTQHSASMDKLKAARIGNGKYRGIRHYAEEPCVLLFTFSGKEVKIEQNPVGRDCDFGARGYADFTCFKFSDRVQDFNSYFSFHRYWTE